MEDLTAREVAPEHPVRELRDPIVTVRHHSGRRRSRLEERIVLVELSHRKGDPRLAPRVRRLDPSVRHHPVAPLPGVPTEVAAERNDVERLDHTLADVGHEEVAGRWVPVEPLWITNPRREDLTQRTVIAVSCVRVVRRHTVAPVHAVGAQRVDPQDLAEHSAEVLRDVQLVARRASVRHAEVQQTEVRSARRRRPVEADPAAVVVVKGLLRTQQLPRRAAVVRRGGGVTCGPLEEHDVVRGVPPTRDEVGLQSRVVRVDPRVELPVARRAWLIELRMKGKTLEPHFHDRCPFGCLHFDLPPGLTGIEVLGHSAVVADRVHEAPHVVDKKTGRARLVDEHHRPGGRPVDIGERSELLEPNDDHTLGGRDRVRERVVRDLSDGGVGDQHGCYGYSSLNNGANHGHAVRLLLSGRPRCRTDCD